jgi:hypothetical protein
MLPCSGPGPAHRDTPDLRQDQTAVLQTGTIALCFVGAAVPAGASLQACKARLLASGSPAEERLLRRVQPRQHILQHVAMESGVLGELGTNVLEIGVLLLPRDADVAPLPGGDALVEGDVVERATAPQHPLQRTLLSGRGPQLLLVGRAHALLVHRALCCLTAVYPATGEDAGLRQERLTAWPGLKPSGLRRAQALFGQPSCGAHANRRRLVRKLGEIVRIPEGGFLLIAVERGDRAVCLGWVVRTLKRWFITHGCLLTFHARYARRTFGLARRAATG